MNLFIILYFLAIGSSPDDGSSKNYKSGPPLFNFSIKIYSSHLNIKPIRALATHNFLLFPPDKSFDLVLTKLSNYIAFYKEIVFQCNNFVNNIIIFLNSIIFSNI
jgi:hypothetical protein